MIFFGFYFMKSTLTARYFIRLVSAVVYAVTSILLTDTEQSMIAQERSSPTTILNYIYIKVEKDIFVTNNILSLNIPWIGAMDNPRTCWRQLM